MKLYSLALLATVAVAQTPAPKPVPRVADTAAHCICLTDGHGCGKSDTKKACELGGGTWVTPFVISGTGTQNPVGDTLRMTSGTVPQTLINISPYSNLFVGAVTAGAYPVKVTASKDFKESVDVNSQTGRVVKLSDEEYERLQKLRQAVADEEKKIAAAHGVDFGYDPCKAAQTPGAPGYYPGIIACYADVPRWPDTYEFRGQWLLINVPPRAKEGK